MNSSSSSKVKTSGAQKGNPYQSKLSKYRILGLVGQGQFGQVFCGCHRKTGQVVALKNLDRNRFPTHKFLRELRFLLSLQHQNIVTCKALEHSGTGRYLVMDYCEGGTLRSLMEGDTHLELAQSLKLVADILAGLEHAHSRGIVHCDIKPENILLSLRSESWIARISDFGIARLSQELNQGTGNTGSPAYMAPERFYGQYSPSSDIYAVGVLLYELVVGNRPFSGAPADLMSAHLNQPVKFSLSVPLDLQAVISTALQKLPARRFRTAIEMLEMLQAVRSSLGLGSEKQVLLPSVAEYASPVAVDLGTQQWEIASAVAPITAVAIAKNSIYWASENRVCYQSALDATHQNLIALDAPVQALVAHPQGCFAITPRSIYALEQEDPIKSALVAQFESDFIAAVEPQGRWISTITSATSEFSIVKCDRTFKAIEAKLTTQMLPAQLLALDARHVVAIAPRERDTLLKVFTRRSTLVGSWTLPVRLERAIVGAMPYRLLAVTGMSQLVLIDLKPLRMWRLRADVGFPIDLAATSWGFLVADSRKQLTLLDNDGQAVGKIGFDGIGGIDAIASLSASEAIVATHCDRQGSLHALDLRQFEVDLLF